jgi:hypothetical protein
LYPGFRYRLLASPENVATLYSERRETGKAQLRSGIGDFPMAGNKSTAERFRREHP